MFRKNMLRTNLLLIIGSLLIFNGCASTQYLTAKDRADTRSVFLDNVYVADHIYYMGVSTVPPESEDGVENKNQPKGMTVHQQQEFIEKMQQEKGIDVRKMVANEFKQQLDKNKLFAVGKKNSDAVLSIEVPMYGLSIKNGFSVMLRPVLKVVGTLKRPDGRMIWSSSAFINVMGSDTPEFEFDQIKENSDNLRQLYKKATEIAVQRLIETLKRDA